MSRIGIIGLGLMGGSLGMALRRADAQYEVLGYARRSETRELALEVGAVDEAFEQMADMVSQSDLLVCCLPVMAIVEVLKECVPHLREGAVVTDVGSTKTVIEHDISNAMSGVGASFIGSHPICGSELQGIESATANLYDGAVTVITPSPQIRQDAVDSLMSMWRSVGSRVIAMEPEEHDKYLARTSHLPHLIACILSTVVAREDCDGDLASFCGTGFRDSTRLADGSSAIWRDIVHTNRTAIAEELRQLSSETERLLRMIESDDLPALEEFLTQSRISRRRLLGDGGDES